MDENQNNADRWDAPRTYGEESRMYEEQGNAYENRQGYGQQQNPYQQNPYQQQYGYQQNLYRQNTYHPPVSNVFCYLLLVVMPLRIFTAIPTVMGIYQMLYTGHDSFLTAGPATIFSLFGSLLSILYFIFVIIDIINMNRSGYKIIGLVLFALLLNPGYYIWRAYLLRQNMTAPIIYTVCYALLCVGYFMFAIFYGFSLGMQMIM